MSVVNDGHEHLTGAMDGEGFLDQQAFATMVVPLELNLKSLAQDARGVVVGGEGMVDDGRYYPLGIVVEQRLSTASFGLSKGVRWLQRQNGR